MFDRWKFKKRLDSFEEEFGAFSRRLSSLEIQWMDTLDRLKTMMGRVVKDRARAEAARGETVVVDERDAGGSEGAIPGSPGLSPRQMELNEKILRRRMVRQ